MKKIIAHNKSFLLLFAIIWIALGAILVVFDKATIHLFVNQYHTPFFDAIFKNVTHLGDGLTPTFLAIVFLLFFSIRKGFVIGGGAIIAGIFAQFLKRVVFSDVLRPKAYLGEIAELYLINGVDVHSFNSFPSGHATTSFCLFFTLAWLTKHNAYNVLWFLVALLVAFTRVYLSQHFLIDIYFGAILGILSAFISILIFSKWQKKWLDSSLIKVLLR